MRLRDGETGAARLADLLTSMGVHYAQGWPCDKPQPLVDLYASPGTSPDGSEPGQLERGCMSGR